MKFMMLYVMKKREREENVSSIKNNHLCSTSNISFVNNTCSYYSRKCTLIIEKLCKQQSMMYFCFLFYRLLFHVNTLQLLEENVHYVKKMILKQD